MSNLIKVINSFWLEVNLYNWFQAAKSQSLDLLYLCAHLFRMSHHLTCLVILKRNVTDNIKDFILWISAPALENGLNTKCHLHLRDSTYWQIIQFRIKTSFCSLCLDWVNYIYDHLQRDFRLLWHSTTSIQDIIQLCLHPYWDSALFSFFSLQLSLFEFSLSFI